MTAEIKELFPGVLDVVNHNEVIAPDRILEANKGRFEKLFVVGIENEELVLIGSHSITEMYAHLGIAMREIEDILTGKK